MSKTQHTRAGWLVGAMGVCLLVAGAAGADVSTDRPGSILIFPKVVNDGTRQTVIQISNTGNSTTQARCFYLHGDTCGETDFNIALTKQQPTHWNVGDGRSPFSGRITSQYGQGGLAPGLVPAVPLGFEGALLCVEVDGGDAPIPGNHLKGEATLLGGLSNTSDVSKYNGIAIHGTSNNANNTLALDNAEYNACPGATRVNLVNPRVVDPGAQSLGNWGLCGDPAGQVCSGASDCNDACFEGTCTISGVLCDVAAGCGVGEGTCSPFASVSTSVTVLPCNLDLNGLIPTRVQLSLAGTDGLEQTFSAIETVTCWRSFLLDVPTADTPFATIDIVSQSGGPVLAVVEAVHGDANLNVSTAAMNAHIETGTCAGGERVGKSCSYASDCPLDGGGNSTCVAPAATIKLPTN